jgi:hypothetical protein
LNDAVTVIKWLSEGAVELCRRLRCLRAMETVLTLTSLAINGSLELPFKLPINTWAMSLLTRVIGTPEYAASLLQGIRRIGSRSMHQLINRLTRISY